jgi:hypothetical protein
VQRNDIGIHVRAASIRSSFVRPQTSQESTAWTADQAHAPVEHHCAPYASPSASGTLGTTTLSKTVPLPPSFSSPVTHRSNPGEPRSMRDLSRPIYVDPRAHVSPETEPVWSNQ